MEVFFVGRVIEVDRVSREIVAVMYEREHRLENASGAEGYCVIIADVAGGRV